MVWIKYRDRIHGQIVDVEVSEAVARYLWAADRKWRRLMLKARFYERSFNNSIFEDDDEITFEETIADPNVDVEKEVEDKIFAEVIWAVAKNLTPLQQEIMRERYILDMRMSDIAKKHNMTRSALTQFMATAHKHFAFYLTHDKEFIKTYWFETHYKEISQDIIDTAKDELSNNKFTLNMETLDNIEKFAKEMTQYIKIGDKLNAGLTPKQKELWQKMSKVVCGTIKELKNNLKNKNLDQK